MTALLILRYDLGGFRREDRTCVAELQNVLYNTSLITMIVRCYIVCCATDQDHTSEWGVDEDLGKSRSQTFPSVVFPRLESNSIPRRMPNEGRTLKEMLTISRI